MSGRIIQLPEDPHREVQSLLPWYVAGRLDEDDRAQVKAHLLACPDCQAELMAERQLAVEATDLAAVADAPGLDVEHGWQAIRRQIDRERRARSPIATLRARLAAGAGRAREDWLTGAPWMRWAVACQLVLVLATGAVAWRTTQPTRYHALGAAPANAAGNLVIIFRPDTRESDLREILKAANARLVDGPTVAGAYVIHVLATERGATVAKLRRRSQVVLVEPVDAAEPPP